MVSFSFALVLNQERTVLGRRRLSSRMSVTRVPAFSCSVPRETISVSHCLLTAVMGESS